MRILLHVYFTMMLLREKIHWIQPIAPVSNSQIFHFEREREIGERESL